MTDHETSPPPPRDGARCRRRDRGHRLAGGRGAADVVRDALPVRGVLDRHHPRRATARARSVDRLEPPRRRRRPAWSAAAPAWSPRPCPTAPTATAATSWSTTATASRRCTPTCRRVNVGVGQTVDQGSLLGLVGETGNATGPAPALRGAAQRQDRAARGSTARSSSSASRSSRRTAPTCRWRATSSATASPSWRSSTGPPPPSRSASRPGRSRCPTVGHRPAGRRRLGRRRHDQPRRTPLLRPHVLPRHPGGHPAGRDGQPQRPPGRRRLGRRPRGTSGSARRRATSSGCASPTASPSPSGWARRATSRSPATGTATASPTSASTTSPRRASRCGSRTPTAWSG